MTSALRWATMRAILMFHNCEGQSHKTVSIDHNFLRERRAEADSNRGPSAYQPNALPLRQTGSRGLHPQACTYMYRSMPVDRVQYPGFPKIVYSGSWLLFTSEAVGLGIELHASCFVFFVFVCFLCWLVGCCGFCLFCCCWF